MPHCLREACSALASSRCCYLHNAIRPSPSFSPSRLFIFWVSSSLLPVVFSSCSSATRRGRSRRWRKEGTGAAAAATSAVMWRRHRPSQGESSLPFGSQHGMISADGCMQILACGEGGGRCTVHCWLQRQGGTSRCGTHCCSAPMLQLLSSPLFWFSSVNGWQWPTAGSLNASGNPMLLLCHHAVVIIASLTSPSPSSLTAVHLTTLPLPLLPLQWGPPTLSILLPPPLPPAGAAAAV